MDYRTFDGHKHDQCPGCRGRGTVSTYMGMAGNHDEEDRKCSRCHGKGYVQKVVTRPLPTVPVFHHGGVVPRDLHDDPGRAHGRGHRPSPADPERARLRLTRLQPGTAAQGGGGGVGGGGRPPRGDRPVR